MKIITTSWDDGHPKDFKIAELLDKYGLAGTFYIPKTNQEAQVMSEQSIVELSKYFEIGGHTLSHVRLHSTSRNFLEKEIKGCYTWLEELVGYAPSSFCFPGGVYNQAGIASVIDAGFETFRTTRLLSVKPAKGFELSTTLQVYQHQRTAYFRHLLKRAKFINLFQWMKNKAETDLLKLTDFYLKEIEEKGGCFHLWGHSWEIERFGLWKNLEALLHKLSGLGGFQNLANKDLALLSQKEQSSIIR